MQHGHPLRDGQPQATDAAAAALYGRVMQRQAAVPPLVQFARQTWPAVFDHDFGLRAFATQARTRGMAARRVAHGIVDEASTRHARSIAGLNRAKQNAHSRALHSLR